MLSQRQFISSLCLLVLVIATGCSGGTDQSEIPITETVIRGDFQSIVLDQGEVESSNNVEIRCEVRSRNSSGTTILEVMAEGESVRGAYVTWDKDPLVMGYLAPMQWGLAKASMPDTWPWRGEVLVRLDSSALEQERDQQQVIVNTSEARVIQAESELEAAKIVKEEYLLGTFKQDEQTILNEVFEAEENQRKAEQYLKFSERLAAKSYVTALQLEADRFAVKKAKNSLGLANRKLDVLRNQTKRKMLVEYDALIRAAAVTYENELKSHQVEVDKLDEINDQIAKCVIRTPPGVKGQVVHANKFSSRGNAEFVVEEGVSVREKQVIIRLPDPKQMQVKAKINESRITSVRVGMPVRVQLDALNDKALVGQVTRVNQYAEPGGFSSGGIKKYAVFVKILDPPPEIRPGMNASVSIVVEHQQDAVQIPLKAVYSTQGRSFCLVEENGEYETKEIEIVSNNERMVLVKSGVQPGEVVVMNTVAYPHLMNLPEIPEADNEELLASISRVATQGGNNSQGKDKQKSQKHPQSERKSDEGRPQGRPSPSAMFDNFDTNKDKQISAEEIAAHNNDWLNRLAKSADANGDSNISKGEFFQAMAKQRSQFKGGKPPAAGGGE